MTPSTAELPPYSQTAENALLGTVMAYDREAMPICVERIPTPNYFYDLRNQTIFMKMCEMFDKRMPINNVTVYEYLSPNKREFELCGGMDHFTEVISAETALMNLEPLIECLRQKFVLRRLSRACADIGKRIPEVNGDFNEFLEQACRKLSVATNESSGARDTPAFKSLIASAVDRLEKYHQGEGKPNGIMTGFIDLDKLTFGLQGGEMIVLAGRPSTGKTSLAMNIVDYVAVNSGIPVGVFSMEMTAESLVDRMISARARIPRRTILSGNYSEETFRSLTTATAKLSKAPIHIDDTGGLSLAQLTAKSIRMVEQFGVKLLVIDYLQLMNDRTGHKGEDSRQLEVTRISGGCKKIAKDLKVPVIVLSQLNRQLEKDKARKPRLSDLRESGSIEQDADLVGMLYSPVGAEDDCTDEVMPVNLLIAKGRNYGTSDIPLTFLKTMTKFESAAKAPRESLF